MMSALSGAVALGQGCEVTLDENIDSAGTGNL